MVFNTFRKRYSSPQVTESRYLPKILCASEASPFDLELQVSTTLAGKDLSPDEQLQIVSTLFTEYCTKHKDIKVPGDFLQLTLAAMENLKKAGRSNVVYQLSKAVGLTRADESDTLMPCRRMPMGLIEHCVNQFLQFQLHDYSE